jgi:hypothetical protein
MQFSIALIKVFHSLKVQLVAMAFCKVKGEKLEGIRSKERWLLDTDTDLTVFRKLQQIGYLTSYTIGDASTLSPKSLTLAITGWLRSILCGRW